MSRLEVPNDEYTIQSLSELYLASINTNAQQKTAVHTQTILADLRRRLSMNPNAGINPSRRQSYVPAQITANSPLELLFKPPNRFFVTQASSEFQAPNNQNDSNQNTQQSSSFPHHEHVERTESSFSETHTAFMKIQKSSVFKTQMWVYDFLNRPQNPNDTL